MPSLFLQTRLTGFLLLLGLYSCRTESPKAPPVDESRIVARIGEELFEKQEYNRMYQSLKSPGEDSIKLATRIIDNWARERLLYLAAVSSLGEEALQVDKQVEEYRKSLVKHLYFEKLVDANLDTVITEDEIRDYYNAHRDNFVLKENLAKVDYIKVPVKAPDLPKIRKLLSSQKPGDREKLEVLCMGNAENYFLNDSTWLYTSDIRKEIPKLADEPDFVLHTGKTVVFEDEEYLYYLKIKDLKIKNGLSPLNFERDNIKKYILLNRKNYLLNVQRQNLLDEARATGQLKLTGKKQAP